MNLYGFEFSLVEQIILCVLVVAFIYELSFYLVYIRGVIRYRNKIKKKIVTFPVEQPPVSIIISARDEVENLRKFLPFVLNQEYPDFEVIVINDGSSDETADLLDHLKKEYSRLRTTFVPSGTKNISTKKLALTLGIKAAQNDWLLFTDADCMPEDKCWIARMARNFTQGTEFVLGYGAYFNKKGFVNKLITYDTLFIALQYLGFALKGKPYMGVGRNMAYRKEVFFRQNGFASTLHLRSGDDDLMVNKAANEFNTKVEIAPDSITWSEPNKHFKDWYYQKERHLSVSSYYTSASKFRISIEPFFRAIFYLSFIATLIFGNMVTMIAAGVIFIARYITQMLIINASAKYFGERRYYFLILLFDIMLPVINLHLMTFGRMGSKAKHIYWK
ncbi:MAG: glycosyltransferase [Paludibacter sp.]|nr:glycosyltransferase [Paludibacter sp.]